LLPREKTIGNDGGHALEVHDTYRSSVIRSRRQTVTFAEGVPA
jgi:hypothetical protein